MGGDNRDTEGAGMGDHRGLKPIVLEGLEEGICAKRGRTQYDLPIFA